MIAGTIEIQLLANMARLQKDMDDAKRTVSGAMAGIEAAINVAKTAIAGMVAGLSVGAFVGFIRSAIEAKAGLQQLSEQTGSTVESLSALKSIARLSETSMDNVADVINKLSKNMVAARDPASAAGIAFKALGVSSKDIAENMDDPAKMLLVLAKNLDRFKDGAGKTDIQMTLMGKSVASILPMLKDLAEHNELIARTTNQQSAEADKFEKIMVQMGGKWKGIYSIIADEILPVLNEFFGAMLKGGGIAKTLTEYVRELAKEGKIREWAETAKAGIDSFMSAVVPAIKILAAWFAIFVAAPAIYAAVTGALTFLYSALGKVIVGMLTGQASTLGFNTVLFGTSVAANLASGALKTLQLAGMVLFAAFAGWELGKYLSDNFVEARVAGLMFVSATLKGWENLKYGAEMAWEGIKFAWDTTINLMKGSFAEYLLTVATGLKAVGATAVATEVAAYAGSLQKAASSQKTFAEQTAGITEAHIKTIAAIDDDITRTIDWEMSNKKAAKTAKESTEVQKISNDELVKAAQRIKDEEDRKAAAALAGAAAAKKEVEAYNTLIAAIKGKTEENRLELIIGENASESQKELIKLEQQLASGKLVLTAAHIAAAKAAIQEQAATEALLKTRNAEKATLDWIIASTKLRLAAKDALASEYAMYGKSNDEKEITLIALKAEVELQEELEKRRKAMLPVTDEKLGQMRREKDLRVEVLQSTLAQSKALGYAEQLAIDNKRFAAEAIFDEKQKAAAILEIDADVWRKRILVAGEGSDAQKKLQTEFNTWYSNQALKPQLEEQKKIWDSIDQTAHDTFVSIFDSGKTAFERLRDTLKNTLLDLLYQMTIKKWIVSIGTSVSENIVGGAVNAVAGASSSGGSSIFGNIANLFSAGKSLWAGFSSGFAATSGMDSGLAAMYASAKTSGNLSAGASAGGTAGNYAFAGGIAAAVLAAMSYNNSLYKQGWNIRNGTEANGVGTLVNGGLPTNGFLSLFSSVGAVKLSDSIMQKLGMSSQLASLLSGSSVIASLFGNKDPEVTRKYVTGTFSNQGFAGQNNLDWFSKGGVFSSDKSGTQTGTLDTGFSTALSKQYEAITTATSIFAESLGVNADYIKTRTQSISFDLGKDDAENKANIEKLFADITRDISKEVLNLGDSAGLALSSLAKDGEVASDTLARLSLNFTGVNGIFKDLGLSSLELTKAGIKASDSIITLYGSLDNMKAVSAAYYEKYYSDTEKAAIVTKNLTEEFKTVGYVLPDSLKQLRQWIEAAKALGTEAGDKTYVALMQLTGAFSSLQDIKKPVDDKAAEKSNLMLQIMEAQGLGQQALNLKRQTELILMDDEVRALNEKLDVELANKAARELATRQAYQSVEILKLEGKTVEAAALQHKLEMAAMEDGLKVGAERIYQLGLENDAQEIAKQHRALDIELMRALGQEEAALAAERADSLKGMDTYSQNVTKQIWAANAANDAIAKAKEAAEAEARSQDQARQAAQQEAEKAYQDAKQAYDQQISQDRSDLQEAYNAEAATLQDLISKMGGFAQAARKLQDSLRYGADSPLTRAQKFSLAQAGLPDVIASANRGDSAAVDKLQQYVELLKASASSSEEYAVGVAKVISILDGSADIAETQETIAKNQLAALKKSVDVMMGVDKSIKSVSDALAKLNLDIQTGLTGVSSAVYGQFQANNKSTVTPISTSAVASQSIIDAGPKQAIVADVYARYRDAEKAYGEMVVAAQKKGFAGTESDYTAQFGGRFDLNAEMIKALTAKGYQATEWMSSVPSFDIGTNYVPKDMLAMIHEGESVVPKAFNPAAYGQGNSGYGQMSEVVEKLMAEVEGLRKEARATATNTEIMARLIRRVTPQGDAIATREVTA